MEGKFAPVTVQLAKFFGTESKIVLTGTGTKENQVCFQSSDVRGTTGLRRTYG